MTRKAILTTLVLAALALATSTSALAAVTDGAVAMYFHRTQRCPTCQTIGSWSEDAVKTGFAKEIEGGKVSFHQIDFQNEANAAMTKGYQITGPTLVVAKVRGGRVQSFRAMPGVWKLVGDEDKFYKYVQSGVSAYLED